MIFEARAVTDYILKGKKQSELITPEETIQIMETMDRLREKWGIKYPTEK